MIDRARARRGLLSLDEPALEGEDQMSRSETLPSEQEDPAARAVGRELGRQIEAAVRQLPPEQKEVFLLRMEGDVPFREIARMQGVSINTALARMHYAVNKLRSQLQGQYDARGGAG